MSRVALPSDEVAVVGTIDPDVLTATTHDSDWVDMGSFDRLMAIVQWGELGESAEIDAKLQQAQDAAGTGVKDITGKSITQVSEDVSPQPDDQQAVINLRSEELDVTNAFTHVRLRMTVGTAPCDGSALLLGLAARYKPASDNDLSSVAEIVT